MPGIQYRSDSPAEPTEAQPQVSEYDQRLAEIRAAAAAKAKPLCGQPSRQWGGPQPCTLDRGHRGYHSISTYTCDQCDRRQRLPYAGRQTDQFGEEIVAVFCFGCIKDEERSRWGGWHP